MSAVLFKDAKNFPITANVYVIDDQLTSRVIMENIIRGIGDNIKVSTFETPQAALDATYQAPPDLIVVDYRMPEMNGVEFTQKVRNIPECMDVPIIIFTIIDDKSVMYDSLDAGATDFLTKPIDHYECKVRCRNLLTMRRQQKIIKERAETLERVVFNSTQTIQQREKEVLSIIYNIIDIKGNIAGFNQQRMGMISMLIARELKMEDKFCNDIEIAAPLHDIGEVKLPSYLLLKSSELTHEEFEIVKQHTTLGYEILKNSESPVLNLAANIALNHHEKIDGTGYPNKLKGEQIPIEARIAAVADAFDAMTSDRNHRPAKSTGEVIDFIENEIEITYDRECVNALIENIESVASIENTFEK